MDTLPRRLLCLLALMACGPLRAMPLESEIPRQFHPVHENFDYERREVMIRMRDGVRLFTEILIPKGAHAAPMLLTRTPYDAASMTHQAKSDRLDVTLEGYDNFPELFDDKGYIRVVQDVRGKYRSEGDYVMNRPLRGPLNDTAVDHATDTWDTIDWLVKHVPESNGKVGMLGISYDGFTSLMALVDPHPALKVVVPMNPMVDGWKGDDWFHNGAFRQLSLPYIYGQTSTRDNSEPWWETHRDQYRLFLDAGSAGALGRARGMEQDGFFRKLLAHPAYDAFWQQQAVDKRLGAEPIKVPVLLVHGLWDQEDIYGAIAVYNAIGRNDNVFLVIGPWNHGGQREDGSTLGPLRFGSDTSLYFREQILRPFLDQYLKDGAPPAQLAPVTAFRTGENRWERLNQWPAAAAHARRLYLQAGRRLGFDAPRATTTASYVADPQTPVPFVPRPIIANGVEGNVWQKWLALDQRDSSSRPDVLSFVTDVLQAPLRIGGQPLADLTLSTTGSDGDFVVKLIDVYPEQVAAQAEMGGYELMVAADILRGRYRDNPARPGPMPPNRPVSIRFPLPSANHTFLPGHRVMVQIQSSWFPLYDRNPQTYVDNIFLAAPADYRKATITVDLGGAHGSALILPVLDAATP